MVGSLGKVLLVPLPQFLCNVSPLIVTRTSLTQGLNSQSPVPQMKAPILNPDIERLKEPNSQIVHLSSGRRLKPSTPLRGP